MVSARSNLILTYIVKEHAAIGSILKFLTNKNALTHLCAGRSYKIGQVVVSNPLSISLPLLRYVRV